MKRLLLLAILATVAAGVVWQLGRGGIGTYPRRNVLVITVDTLRPDRLGAYGYSRATSPAVDRLAGRGITFEKAFAPRGMTWPSLATMLTALKPSTTNVRWNGQYLPQGVATIPGLLRDSGYRTAAFLGGSICHMAGASGAFDVLECGDDPAITASAGAFLGKPDDKPFFAWVHLMAPHAPYRPPAEHDVFTTPGYTGPVARERVFLDGLITRQVALEEADLDQLHGLYDGEVRHADALVGEMLTTLREKGLEDETIVVFTADHGEDLYEHNRYLYHACSIYDSSLRIPLILALPDGEQAARRYTPVVELIDLAPTLLELVGVDRLPSFEGKSMLARLEGSEQPADPVAPSEWYDPARKKSLQTVRTARWRYISNPENLTPNCVPGGDYYKVAREELYDHDADPHEQHNVAAEHPEVVEVLSQLAGAGRAATADDAPLPVDEKLREELRSFGYVE